MNKQRLKELIDKPITTDKFRAFDRMVTELGPYMNIFEVDQCVEFMFTIENSQYDINPSISDCKTQLQLILGKDRYDQIVSEWKQNNQRLLTSFGTLKFKRKSDGSIWDGLDDTDDPNDYDKIYT
jgi:hypothetical protein